MNQTSRSFRRSSLTVPALLGAALLAACGGSGQTSSSSQSTGSGGTGGSGSTGTGGSTPVTVTPSDANVLTCSTLQLEETGAGNGKWTVAPATGTGSIDGSGLYTAPLSVPPSPDVTATYAETAGSASASLHLATAFLGSAGMVPTNGSDNAVEGVPFEHAFSANGSRIYGGFIGPEVTSGGYALEADLVVSKDNGKTFTAAAAYHTGLLECATAAVDAGDPNVVYLVYYAGHGDSSSNTGATVRLAVSEDGGQTFPHEYVVADSDNSMADFICPDVASPSPDHVIVTGIVAPDDGHAWAGAFVSGNRGKDIGPEGVEGQPIALNPDPENPYSSSDTNAGTVSDCAYGDNGNGFGPRVFSNGKGVACLAYSAFGGDCATPGGMMVQCSKDSGATWTAPLAVAVPQASDAKNRFTGAVSPGGKVAVTWLGASAGSDEIFIAISKDGGKTFAAPFQYPTASRMAAGGDYTGNPVLAWENDSVLWLSQTLDAADNNSVIVDKTCDDGASWSGWVSVGAYEGMSLLPTAAGMVVTAYTSGTNAVLAVPLEQLTP